MHDLENQLAQRTCPEPSAELRGRILGNLVDAPVPVCSRAHRAWRIAWRMAVLVVVVLNVALTVENEIRFGDLNSRRMPQEAPKPPAEPWPQPGMYEDERGWESVTTHALASLTRRPDVGVFSRDYFREEGKVW